MQAIETTLFVDHVHSPLFIISKVSVAVNL